MDKNPQRKDEHAKTVKYPVGEQHGAVVNENDQFFKNPPNNLGLKNPEDQDRASDLIGNTHTEVRLRGSLLLSESVLTCVTAAADL